MSAKVPTSILRRSATRAAAASVWMLLPSPASAQLAWWLTERFTPTATSYEGLTTRDLDPAWETFSVLSYSALPPSARPDLGWMRKEGFSFAKEGDFNRDGKRDRAVTGVYVDRAGRPGRFLLVLEQQDGKWRKTFLHREAAEAGFSVVFGPTNQVHWARCMECGEGSWLSPRGATYTLQARAND